jgi:hypothetical protein
MRTRILLLVAVGATCLLGFTTAATGAGPSPGVSQGSTGLTHGKERYIALPAGNRTTVEVIRRGGGNVLRFMSIKGAWGIPLVAFDGTADGLMPDGRTLILAQSIYAGEGFRQRTSFTFVDMRKMKQVDTITMPGTFAFDALSPNGRYLYLIQYLSAEQPAQYRVRAYDLKAGRLLAKIVSDKRTWASAMQGMPITRTSADGWAYTLYGATPARPFIHALDTRHVAAVCINLPWKYQPDKIWDFRLRTDGDGHLVVRGPHGRALAVIDRESFRILSAVREP